MKASFEIKRKKQTDKQKLLAIVIPCHNVTKKFNVLDGLKQINEKRIELILINDSSTDETLKLLKKLKEDLKIDVTIINGAFHGPGGARNVGIQAAKAKYIWFVDADDRIFPSPILLNLSRLENGKLDVLSFKTKYSLTKKNREVLSSTFEKPDEFGNTKDCRLCGDIVLRDILIKNNLRYPTNVYMREDSAFFIKLAFHINKQEIVDEIVYEYVQNNDSLSHGNLKHTLSTWLAAKEIVDFCSTLKIKKQEKIGILKFAVRSSMLNTWVRYRDKGEKLELIRLMPKMIAASRQMGIFNYLQPFYEESYSWETRMLKKAIIASCYPLSFFIKDGLKSLEKEYSTQNM